jgi:hypothetical protein
MKYILIFLTIFSINTYAQNYKAIISCGMNGKNINALACFDGTDLKITQNGQSKVYKHYQMNQLGSTYADGIHIELSSGFKLRAQNSDGTLVLGVKILDGSGKAVFNEEAGQYEVIMAVFE